MQVPLQPLTVGRRACRHSVATVDVDRRWPDDADDQDRGPAPAAPGTAEHGGSACGAAVSQAA